MKKFVSPLTALVLVLSLTAQGAKINVVDTANDFAELARACLESVAFSLRGL